MLTETWRGASSERARQSTHVAQQVDAALQHFLRSYSLFAFGCSLNDLSKPSLLTRAWISQDPHTCRINALLLMERVGFNNGNRKEYDLYTEVLRHSRWTPHRDWDALMGATSLLQTDDGAGLVLSAQV